MNFEQLATIITDTHQQLQQSAVKAVNQCQTMRNWLMGFYIVEFEQNGEDRAVYGDLLLKNLENDRSARVKCHFVSMGKKILSYLPDFCKADR